MLGGGDEGGVAPVAPPACGRASEPAPRVVLGHETGSKA